MTKNEVPLIKNKDSDKPTKVGGYNLKDIAKAPVKPVEPDELEPKEYTKNSAVKFLIVTAAVLALCGVFIILLNLLLIGLFLLLLAAVMTVIAVFYPVK